MDARLNYTLSQDDYAAAVRARDRRQRHALPAEGRRRWAFIVSLVSLTAGIFCWLHFMPALTSAWHALWQWLSIILVFGWLLLVGAMVQKDMISHHWIAQDHLHKPRSAEISAEGLTIRYPEVSQSYTWNAFRRFEETPNLFLLFPSDFTFEILPKRAFHDSEGVARFRTFLENRLQAAQRDSARSAKTPPPRLFRVERVEDRSMM